MRLDQYLVLNNYFKTRSKATDAIKKGAVIVDGKKIDKPSYDIENAKIEITNDVCPYVSRGGYKLEAAIKEFMLDFKDKKVLDIGASTGGFTDCSLKHGASLVYSVDVGENQLDLSLKNDLRVRSFEKTNIKDFNLSDKVDYIVMDVSFVSIEYLLPSIVKFINEENSFICLIKPQFELGGMKFKGGIVKDKNLHKKVLDNVISELSKYNLGIKKLIPSPILGGDGNKEFLALIKLNIKTNINVLEVIK